MKKFVTFLTTGLLTVMLSTTVFADTASDVWYTDNRESETTYSVVLETSGKTADGLIEIKFDKDALSCKEGDIEVADDVDMHAVNVEDGSVKISYLSEKSVPAGSMIEVTFAVSEEYADKEVSVTVTSVTHNEAGDVVVSGAIDKPEEPEETEETEETETEETETEETESEETESEDKPDKSDDTNNDNSEKPEDSKPAVATAVATGDTIYAAAGILILVIGLVVVAVVVKKKKAK